MDRTNQMNGSLPNKRMERTGMTHRHYLDTLSAGHSFAVR
jgi:hypothetical protein